ncbi:MAG: hypothetical protein H7138_07780 [Myxococcales bacterium]|nr:hypothetical protein [Myxococcales bacterium]
MPTTQRFRTPAELATAVTMSGPSDDSAVFYDCIVKARAAYVSVPAIGALVRAAFHETAAETDGFEMRAEPVLDGADTDQVLAATG